MGLSRRAKTIPNYRLSSPSSFLSHPYRPSGTYPAILFAPDAPPTFKNAWNKYSMPCACFLYARTSSHLSHLASSLSPTSADHYRPAEDAAHAWRTTALCHISMLLHELTVAREQASRLFDPTTSIEGLVRAKAPSFQATALGPALFLLSQPLPTLPRVSHAEWLEALGSANVDDLLALLDEAQLGPSSGTSCLDLAQRNWDLSPNPQRELVDDTGVLRPDGDEVNRGARVEALPYGEFPPGMSYFGREEEAGVRPCVVHANYATGMEKERLLRERGLWALGGGEEEGWTCDAGVMSSA